MAAEEQIRKIEDRWGELENSYKKLIDDHGLKNFLNSDPLDLSPSDIRLFRNHVLESNDLIVNIMTSQVNLKNEIGNSDIKHPKVQVYESTLHEIKNYLIRIMSVYKLMNLYLHNGQEDNFIDDLEMFHNTLKTGIDEFREMFLEMKNESFSRTYNLPDRIKQTFEIHAPDREINIETVGEGHMIKAPIKPFLELLGNLAKNVYAHSEGPVDIKIFRGHDEYDDNERRVKRKNNTDQTKDMIHLSITNKGKIPDLNENGLPVWSKLFDGRTTTRPGGVTVGEGGIGLAQIIPDALKKLGANLRVVSEGEGEEAKTTFTVMFPASMRPKVK